MVYVTVLGFLQGRNKMVILCVSILLNWFCAVVIKNDKVTDLWLVVLIIVDL